MWLNITFWDLAQGIFYAPSIWIVFALLIITYWLIDLYKKRPIKFISVGRVISSIILSIILNLVYIGFKEDVVDFFRILFS